jgi:Glycosyltransferase
LPPPVSGMALVTEAVIRLVSSKLPTVVCDVSPSALYGSRQSLGILIKLLRHIVVWLRLPFLRLRGVKTLYMPLDSRLGLLFNIITLSIARILGIRFVLHHHVASYVVEPSRAMRWLNGLTNSKDLQIFVCQNLLRQFEKVYPHRSQMQHISNSGLINVDIQAAPGEQLPHTTLVLGMMSVLTMEKGLGVMLDLLDAAAKEELDIRFVIAGPANQPEARRRLDEAIARHPQRLDYRGPVGGETKRRFFEDIDVFVFPTLYRLEAEPLVVIEALTYRRPLITFDRGCIGEIVGSTGGTVIAQNDDFVTRALNVCRGYLGNPATLADAQKAAGERAQERVSQAQDASLRLLEAVSAG